MKAINRLYKYLEYKGIKPTRFEKDFGLSNGYLGTQLRRNGNLGEEILNLVIDNCLDMNPIWLLTGKGEMLLPESPADADYKEQCNCKTEDAVSIPVYNLEATAGIATIFNSNNSHVPMEHLTIPNIPKSDGAMFARGDSMYPLVKNGDLVAYKALSDLDQGIFWGEMHILYINIDGDEMLTIKYVQKSNEKDHVDLVSQNTHHQTKTIHRKFIRSMARVTAIVNYRAMY